MSAFPIMLGVVGCVFSFDSLMLDVVQAATVNGFEEVGSTVIGQGFVLVGFPKLEKYLLNDVFSFFF